MANRTTANIMIVGRTGAGKSELINYVVGKEVAKTGCGEPVTQTFDEYYCSFRDGFRIRVFDSKGLEVDSFNETAMDVEAFIKSKCESDDLSDWLHLVIYCINSKAKRVEPVEIDFIKRIQALTKTSMVVVLTHCDENENAIIAEMEDRIRADLKEIIQLFLYRVNSKNKTKKTGKKMKTFGRKQILDDLDIIVWDNASSRMISEYAEKLRNGLTRIVWEIEKELCEQVDKGEWIDLALNTVPPKKLEKTEKKLKSFVKERTNQFYNCQQALLEMYYAFKDNLGGRSSETAGIEPFIIAENVISLDSLYEVLQKSNFESKKAKEINRLPLFERVIAKIKNRIKIRDEIKDHIHEYCKTMIEKIPSKEEIETAYKQSLQETRNTYLKHTPVMYKYDKRNSE